MICACVVFAVFASALLLRVRRTTQRLPRISVPSSRVAISFANRAAQAVAVLWSPISGAVNFGWEIARLKLAAKRPTRDPGPSAVANLHRACKALHTTPFLGASTNFPPQNPGAFRKSPRREVVRSSAGAGVVYPPFFGVIRVAYPKA